MPFTRKPPPQDDGELDELVARINIGGGKEARGGLQAVGLGVFPSFIAAIFINDVLQSLHHPYVLQSLYDDGVMSPFIPRVRWIHVM
jgi:hypothetical protein